MSLSNRSLGLILAGLSMTVACSANQDVPSAHVPISQGTYAVYLTNVAIGYPTDGTGTGAVLLIDEDGRVLDHAQVTGIMDARLAVDDTTLYFSSATADHLWTDTLTTVTRTDEFLTSILTFGDNGTGRTFFNVGSDDGQGYTSARTNFDATTATTSIFEGLPEGIGDCGDEGIFSDVRIGLLTEDSALFRLDSPVPEQVGPVHPAPFPASFGIELPCRDGNLYDLAQDTAVDSASDSRPERLPPELVTWDTETGARRSVPLTGAPIGNFIDWEGSGTMPSGNLGLVDRFLYWDTDAGNVYASDTNSGETRLVFTTPEVPEFTHVETSIRGDVLIWTAQSGGEMTIIEFDLATGTRRVALTGIELPRSLPGDAFVSDIIRAPSK